MKVVITGVLGCIGLAVTSQLDREKYDITVFDLPESRFEGLKAGYQLLFWFDFG